MKRGTLAVVDDHLIFLKRVRSGMDMFPEFEIVVQAANGEDLMEQIYALDRLPDVVITDLTMPVMDGFKTTKLLKERYPILRVIALSMHTDRDIIRFFQSLEGDGYLSKKSLL